MFAFSSNAMSSPGRTARISARCAMHDTWIAKAGRCLQATWIGTPTHHSTARASSHRAQTLKLTSLESSMSLLLFPDMTGAYASKMR